jgi:hypothetical protein
MSDILNRESRTAICRVPRADRPSVQSARTAETCEDCARSQNMSTQLSRPKIKLINSKLSKSKLTRVSTRGVLTEKNHDKKSMTNDYAISKFRSCSRLFIAIKSQQIFHNTAKFHHFSLSLPFPQSPLRHYSAHS